MLFLYVVWYAFCVWNVHVVCEHVMCLHMCVHVVSLCALCVCMYGAWGMCNGMYSEFVCMFMYMCQGCL